MSQAAVPPLPSGRFGEPLLELGEHARRESTRPERNMTHVQTEIPKHRNLTAPGALTFPVGRLHRVEVARMVMAKNHLKHPTQLARAKHLDCPLGPRKKWKFRATPDRGAHQSQVSEILSGLCKNCVIVEWSIHKLLEIRILYNTVYGRLSQRWRHSCGRSRPWIRRVSGCSVPFKRQFSRSGQ